MQVTLLSYVPRGREHLATEFEPNMRYSNSLQMVDSLLIMKRLLPSRHIRYPKMNQHPYFSPPCACFGRNKSQTKHFLLRQRANACLLRRRANARNVAKHHIPQATNMPYQPLLIKPIFSVLELAHAEKQFFQN